MDEQRILMDSDGVMRVVRRISHEILERNKGISNALIVGIERRGVYLAKRLQREIESIEGIRIECESLNVAMYRDDRDYRPKQGNPCTINTTEKLIILVDDVLYTGRTIRAALNALMETLVLTKPGQTSNTFTFLSSISARNESKKPCRACFEAE